MKDAPCNATDPQITAIQNGLLQLEASLGYFEQTSHGSLGPFTIEGVAESLVAAVNKPTAFTISDLAQRIRRYVNESQ